MHTISDTQSISAVPSKRAMVLLDGDESLRDFDTPVWRSSINGQITFNPRGIRWHEWAELGIWKDTVPSVHAFLAAKSLSRSGAIVRNLRKAVKLFEEVSSCCAGGFSTVSSLRRSRNLGALWGFLYGAAEIRTPDVMQRQSKRAARLCKVALKFCTDLSDEMPLSVEVLLLHLARTNPGLLIERGILSALEPVAGSDNGKKSRLKAISEYAVANYSEVPAYFEPNLLRALDAKTPRILALAQQVGSIVRSAMAHAESVLVVHDIREALGDEWVRNSYLVHSLLAANRFRKVVVVSSRPFLYRHPRVEVIDPADESALRNLPACRRFKVIFLQRFIGANGRISCLLADELANSGALVFRTPLSSNYFTCEYESISLPHAGTISMRNMVCSLANPYDYALRLLSWLGLPGVRPLEVGRTLLGGRPCAEALKWLARNVVACRHAQGRRLLLLNPFGGSYAEKGFAEAEDDILVRYIEELIQQGNYVLVGPNERPWGTAERCQALMHMLAPPLRRFVNCDLPSPDAYPDFYPYLLFLADSYVGVEGGGSHLAMAACRNANILFFERSGFHNWQPLLKARGQQELILEEVWRRRCRK